MPFSPERQAADLELPIRLEELNAKDLEEARRLAADPNYQPDSHSRLQAEGMARVAQIDLRPEEIRLYGALRDQESPSMSGRIAAKGETGKRASALIDQEILAAVLRESGDEERLRKFVGRYPNIFS